MEDSEIMDWIVERIREYAATKPGLILGAAQDRDEGNQWAVRSLMVSRNQSILGEFRIVFEKDHETYKLRAYDAVGAKVRELPFVREEIALGSRDAAETKLKRFLDSVLAELEHAKK